MGRLRWLHIADFHVGKDKYPQLEMFREILAAVDEKRQKGEIPDLIFITGDIANKGKKDEYSKFKNEFYFPLLEKLGNSWQGKIFVVPGNHDVHRDEAKAVRKHGVLEEIKNFLDPDKAGLLERKDLLRRFSAYQQANLPKIRMDWLESSQGTYFEIIEINNISIGILLINTAWLSNNGDKENLTPGISMVKEGLSKIKDCQLKFVLGHHPTDWFLERDREAILSLFGKNKVIYLQGHNHKIRSLTEFGAGEPFLSIQTGASFQVRPEDTIKRNRILWCEFELESSSIKAEPIQWSNKDQNWNIDAEAFPEKFKIVGEDKWGLPLYFPEPMKISPTAPNKTIEPKAAYDPRNSVFYVPYRAKGDQVIGREKALEAVREQLMKGRRTSIGQAALFRGLGGLGKTQLAVEYAYTFKEAYPNGVIWINADQDIEAQLIDIAEKGNWVAPESEHRYKLEIARHRLKSYSDCLIIFDNVEDITDLEDYFPEPQAEPHILITSRLDQQGFNPIPLDPLDEELSLQMLIQEAGRKPIGEVEWDSAREIAKALGGLPLALELVGAYLSHRPVSWMQYNELLQKNLKLGLPAKIASFTKHEADLYSTLKVSERIWEEEPKLKDILDLLTWSGPAAMGLEIMGSLLNVSDPTQLTGALALGQSLHILQKSKEREAYILHRLVRQVRRVEIPLGKRSEWAVTICQRMGDWFEIKRKEFSLLPKFEAEIDHLRAWQDQILNLDKRLASRLTWLQAYPPHHQGLFKESRRWLEKARELLNQVDEGDLELEAHILNDLGAMLDELGDYKNALEYIKKAIDIREKILGKLHRETAQSYTNLGNTYGRIGNKEKHLEYCEEALNICKAILNELDPDMAQSLSNLGGAYGDLGKHMMELEYYNKALDIQKQIRGEKHPRTALYLLNIGVAYRYLGNHEEGINYYEEALGIFEQTMGERHPHTANALHNLGTAYWDNGERKKGANLVERALKTRIEILGEAHPETVKSARVFAKYLFETNQKISAYQLMDGFIKKVPKDNQQYEELKNDMNGMLRAGVPGFRAPGHGKKIRKRR